MQLAACLVFLIGAFIVHPGVGFMTLGLLLMLWNDWMGWGK